MPILIVTFQLLLLSGILIKTTIEQDVQGMCIPWLELLELFTCFCMHQANFP